MARAKATVAAKVDADVAEAVRAIAEDCGETVSDVIREYLEAVATGRRWQLVEDDDGLAGYAFMLGGQGPRG